MKNVIHLTIIFVLSLVLQSCAVKDPFAVTRQDKPKTYSDKKNVPVRDILVPDLLKLEHDLDSIPSGLPVVINLLQPVTLDSFFQLLIGQGVSIVADLQEQSEKFISLPSYHGELKDLLKSVQISHGLFFQYDSGIVTVRTQSPAYVKVLMPNIQESLIELLKSFGVEDSFYDRLSSRIVFTSDYYTYKKIADYFRNNGYLTLVYFDVMILEKADSQEFKHGIDWSGLSLNLSEAINPAAALGVTGSANGLFNLTLATNNLSLQSVVMSLDELRSFDVVQSARISALNGSVCSLDVSEKIPYIEKVTIGRLEGSDDQITQGYDFNIVSSGLILNLKPSVVDNIVSLNFSAKIQSVNEFLEVGTTGQTVQQPITQTRNIKNEIVFKAGETALIGGLKYSKGGVTKSSLSWSDIGFDTKEIKSFLVSILIKSEVVRYVFV